MELSRFFVRIFVGMFVETQWDFMGFMVHINDGLIHCPHKDFLTRMRRQVLTCARNFGDDLGLSRNLEPPKSH